MSEKKKHTEPTQLPEIVWHEPVKQYGYFEVRIPILWKDFMGVDKVKAITTATLNIVEAIKEEYEERLVKLQAADTEVREKVKAETDAKKAEDKAATDAKKAEDKTAAIQKIIKDEPDVVLAKRKEIGEDVISDESAAMIIYAERQKPIEKPADMPKSSTKKKSTPSKPVDTDGYDPPPLPEGDFGKTVRFYKGEYGWSAYLDDVVWEERIPVLFDWLVSIPKEIRHRTGTKYPCISHSGKFLMVNDFEKDFITTAAESKGMEITVKED